MLVDITDPELVERVAHDPRGRSLGAVVNSAGVAVNAPAEAIPLDEWRRHFDVNFFGHVAVSQVLLSALFADGDGRLVNISSIGGRVAFPTYGAYAAAKFAVEGFSDVVRREVARYGVKIIVIEPGTVATAMWDKGIATMVTLAATMTSEQHARYDDLIAAMDKQSRQQAGTEIQPAQVAKVIAGAIQSREPRTRYLVGRDAKLLAGVSRLLNDRMIDRLVARSLRIAKPANPRRAHAQARAYPGSSSRLMRCRMGGG